MDYIDGIPALQTGDPISLVPQYTQELRERINEDTEWMPLTLINGWESTFAAVEIRRKSGLVCFRSEIYGGANNTQPWPPLPLGFRPMDRFAVWLAAAGTTTDQQARLVFQPDGTTHFRGDEISASPGYTLAHIQFLPA